MCMITTRCPRTWQEIATGIDTDPDTFNALPDIPSKLICPACGEEHVWRKADAWLAPATLSAVESATPTR